MAAIVPRMVDSCPGRTLEVCRRKSGGLRHRDRVVRKEDSSVLSVRHKQEIRYELNTSVLQDLTQHLIELVAPLPHARSKLHKTRRGRAGLQEA